MLRTVPLEKRHQREGSSRPEVLRIGLAVWAEELQCCREVASRERYPVCETLGNAF